MTIKHNLLWIESPFFEMELRQSGLSDEDKAFVKHFSDEGYVVFDPQIEDPVLESLKRELHPESSPISGLDLDVPISNKRMTRIQDAWKYNQHVKNIAVNQTVLDKLELLYRRKPIPFQTLNFNVGTEQSTHSDMIHFSSIPERFMCGVWIALEDVDENNGPLHYYPKSHKLPFYEMSDMGIKGSDSRKMKNGYMDYEGYYVHFIQEVISQLGLEKKILKIKKGQALIWAANLLHGGEPISHPGSTRYSQVNHYYFEDCVYYTPLFSDLAIRNIYLKDIVNISTGLHVENKYLGKTVKNKSIGMRNKVKAILPKPLLWLYNSLSQK